MINGSNMFVCLLRRSLVNGHIDHSINFNNFLNEISCSLLLQMISGGSISIW